MDIFDAVIIGAGPAGLLTGIELCKKGWRVCILEKAAFPRTKVCGGFLGPENQRLLERLGVCQDVVATGARPIHRVSLVEGEGCSVRWNLLEREGYGPAWGVDRSRFDQVLFEKARAAGVVLRTGAQMTQLRTGPVNEVTFVENGSRPIRMEAQVLIDASGMNRSRSTTKTAFVGAFTYFENLNVPTDEVGLYFCDGGHVGVTPVGPGSWNVGLVVSKATFDQGNKDLSYIFEQLVQSNQKLRAMFSGTVPNRRWQGVVFPSRHETPVSEGVFNVGSAAAGINPVIGGGMTLAFQSALLLADILGQYPAGHVNIERAAADYQKAFRRKFSYRVRLSWFLGSVAHSSWAGRILKVISIVPQLSFALFNTHHQPYVAAS